MWTTNYIISQILTIFIYVLFCLSYIERSRKQILITNIGSHILQGIVFILLNGNTGFFMSIFFLLRDSYFIFDSNKSKSNNDKICGKDICILALMLLIVSIFSLISYSNIFSLFSILATVLSTIAIWQKNNLIYRFLGIFCSLFWLIYHISLNSYVAIILESVLLVFTIIGFVREIRRIHSKLKYQSEFY